MRSKRTKNTFRPCLDILEARTVPSTVIVDTKLDVVDANDGQTSLREAISMANDTNVDTINFARSAYGTIRLNLGELLVTDDLTINGPGTRRLTISGNNSSRVFNIEGNDVNLVEVSISDLRITEGLADGANGVANPQLEFASAGGGILNQAGAELTLDNVVVFNNTAIGDPNFTIMPTSAATVSGGAIGGGVANFGTLFVNNSTFRANNSIGADDAIGVFSGSAFAGAIANYNSATISDSQFKNNITQAGDNGDGTFAAIASGGAVFNELFLKIEGSSFRRNQAIGGNDSIAETHNGHSLGGAILSGTLVPGQDSTLIIEDSTFDANKSLGGDNNQIKDGFIPPEADAPNNAYGGAITVFQGNATISETSFSRNLAQAGDGGGDQNGSLGVGGGVFFFDFLGSENEITHEIFDSKFVGNKAFGGDGINGGSGGAGIGGGIAKSTLDSAFNGSSTAGTLTISNTLVADNLAKGGSGSVVGVGKGGGIAIVLGETDEIPVVATMTSSTVSSNKAIGGIGGGVFNSGDLTVHDTHFADNKAIGEDGVIITEVPGYEFVGSGLGGGLFNSGQVDVYDSSFDENFSVGDDGVTGKRVLVDEVVLIPGAALGGGLFNVTDATVKDSNFNGNVSKAGDYNAGTFAGNAGGGGAYNDGTLLVTDSSFRNNKSLGGDENTGDIGSGVAYGGGVMSGTVADVEALARPDASLVVTGSSFHNNEAVAGRGNQVGMSSVGSTIELTLPTRADFEFQIVDGGPLDPDPGPNDYPFVPFAAIGSYTFSLNDTGGSSIDITGVTGLLEGTTPSPAELLPYTLAPDVSFGGGTLTNIVRNPDGSIASGDIENLQLQFTLVPQNPNPLGGLNFVTETFLRFDATDVSIPFGPDTFLSLEGDDRFNVFLSPTPNPADPDAELAVIGRNRTLTFNPIAHSPNAAFGGGIVVYQGSSTVEDSHLRGNRAVGGDNGVGVGGGYLALDYFGGVQSTISNSTITGNSAIGGAEGGDGLGGGVAAGDFGSFFGAPGSLTIEDSLIANNLAIGGGGANFEDDEAVIGGDGQGGGIFNQSSLTVKFVAILGNRAEGGDGEVGGNGQGGGIYNANGGTISLHFTSTKWNRANGGDGDSGPDGKGQGGGLFDDGDDFDLDLFSVMWTRFNVASDVGNNFFGF